jgi:hypothetical protein
LIVASIPAWTVHSNTKFPGVVNVTFALAGGGVLGSVSRILLDVDGALRFEVPDA